MFKKQIWLFSFLFLPFAAFWIYQTTCYQPSDAKTYETMVSQREIASSQSYVPTNQSRKQVRKDIWFSQDDCARLHYQIASKGSLLTLTPVKNRFEIVETLDGIRCWMQDKLIKDGIEQEPFQQARYIEAENGVYRHTTQEFIASGVTLSLFRMPGHKLPQQTPNTDDAILSGIARNISFHFGGKTPQFQAVDFNATLERE